MTGMMVNNQYRTSHMIIWSYHCGTIMRMRAVKAKSELSYYLFPRIFWFPLQPWSLCPRVLCLGSGLTWDVLCPAHDAITSSLSLSPWHSSRHVTQLSRYTGPQCGVSRESVLTSWHCEGLWHCHNFCDVMTEYEEYNGKSRESGGSVLWVARCFYFRKIG